MLNRCTNTFWYLIYFHNDKTNEFWLLILLCLKLLQAKRGEAFRCSWIVFSGNQLNYLYKFYVCFAKFRSYFPEAPLCCNLHQTRHKTRRTFFVSWSVNNSLQKYAYASCFCSACFTFSDKTNFHNKYNVEQQYSHLIKILWGNFVFFPSDAHMNTHLCIKNFYYGNDYRGKNIRTKKF